MTSAADRSSLEARTEALLRISRAIETATTLDELLLLALYEMARLLDLPLGSVALASADARSLDVVCTLPPRVGTLPPVDAASFAQIDEAFARREITQFADLNGDPGSHALARALLDAPAQALLLLPLVTQDRAIGVMSMASDVAPRSFGPEELALARVLASQIAAAVAAFRITESAQRRSAELATVNDIAATVTSSLDTHEVYRLVVQKLNEYFHVDAGSLLMLDEQTGELEFVMTLEAGEEKLAGVRVPKGVGVVGYVAETQLPLVVPDAQNHPLFYAKISEGVGYITRSLIAVPMVVKGRTIGVIELLNKLDGEFTNEDVERLMAMAATISVAIENARLFQQVAVGRDRFAAILNSTQDGILMADIHGLVLMANPMLEQLFGLRPNQLVGRPLSELLGELGQRTREIAPPRVIGDDGDVVCTDIEVIRPQRHFVRRISSPVRDAAQQVMGHLEVFHDISQEKELEQLREDYTSMLVHDLRAPLTSIMNGLLMVKRGLGGPITAQQDELITIAHQGSQTMLEMVNNLLDIARMEQGRMPLELEPVSFYRLGDQMLERLQAVLQSRQLTLKSELPLGLPPLSADRDKLARVLQNLLDNAVKFSPSGATIVLGAAVVSPEVETQSLPVQLPAPPKEPCLVAWIRDQGPGIPREFHQRIFDKFGQVHSTRRSRGSGLGLAFCKLAVEAHQGRIWVESVEGQGSTFAFTLPIASENAFELG
jgi:two-component system, NtrC family, sensor histidine kinase KinB